MASDGKLVVRRTRDELYAEVWTTPLATLGERYGISGSGLAKICKSLDIPYPPRSFWSKHAAGKAVPRTPLPPSKAGALHDIEIKPAGVIDINSDKGEPRVIEILVPQRLTDPHPIVAAEIRRREQQRHVASQSKRIGTYAYDPGEFTSLDRRCHRILSALFKALESEGALVRRSDNGVMTAERGGESIDFSLRERSKRVRRPLDESERKWRLPGDKDWKQQLEPTGLLAFDIKTWFPDRGLQRSWAESDQRPMETLLGQILATFISGWPMLIEQTRERNEFQERWREQERQRHELLRIHKQNDNRWRHFVQLAEEKREADLARQLLKDIVIPEEWAATKVGDLTMAEWMEWLERRIRETDQISRDPERLFKQLSAITDQSGSSTNPSIGRW